jgi:O-antigen/teichoic acid export membrane protein
LTPLSRLWFTYVANLKPDRIPVALNALAIGVPLTVVSIYISFYQGIIVNKEKTGPVAESVVLFLITLSAILLFGVLTEAFTGVYIASAAFSAAHLVQALWLMIRSRKQRRVLADGYTS